MQRRMQTNQSRTQTPFSLSIRNITLPLYATIAASEPEKTTASSAENGAAVRKYPRGYVTIAGSAVAKTTAASAENGAAVRKYPLPYATTADSEIGKTIAANAENGPPEYNFVPAPWKLCEPRPTLGRDSCP